MQIKWLRKLKPNFPKTIKWFLSKMGHQKPEMQNLVKRLKNEFAVYRSGTKNQNGLPRKIVVMVNFNKTSHNNHYVNQTI